MTNNYPGMPGLGGSMGQCAVCGEPFLAAIFGVGKVKQFQITGCNQVLSGHEKCVKSLQTIKEFKDLPDASPLKKAWLQQQKKGARNE